MTTVIAKLTVKLDTGAEVSVLLMHLYNKWFALFHGTEQNDIFQAFFTRLS